MLQGSRFLGADRRLRRHTGARVVARDQPLRLLAFDGGCAFLCEAKAKASVQTQVLLTLSGLYSRENNYGTRCAAQRVVAYRAQLSLESRHRPRRAKKAETSAILSLVWRAAWR